MLAVKSRAKFTDYYLADDNADFLTALRQRISGLELPEGTSVGYYCGNADNVAKDILKDLPPARNSLGLAVFDPWGWDFSFETIADIAESRRLDLAVNFPIGYIKRNWEKELPMLDKFMNGNGYRDRFQSAMRRETPGELPARILLDAYTNELNAIGYSYVRDRVMVANSRNLTLYYLIFASKHERGADFWDKVTDRKQSGQFRMAL